MDEISFFEHSDLYINKMSREGFLFDAHGQRIEISKDNIFINEILETNISSLDSEFRLKHRGHFYRITQIKTMAGYFLVIRKLEPGFTTLNQLRLHTGVLNKMMAINSGLVLIAGKMRNGKSTTARCFVLDRILQGGMATTIEQPVEVEMQGPWGSGYIFQIGVKENGMSEEIRKVVRSSSNIILVGEIRDADTAVAALNAGTTGALVVSTTHGNSIVQALVRLHSLATEKMDTRDAASLLSESLSAIVHQQLIADSKLRLAWLSLCNGDERVKAFIRNRNFELLETEIDAQLARMNNGAKS